ncbi:MAG: amino acid ABC transporter permease [Rhizobiaceae bacterium]
MGQSWDFRLVFSNFDFLVEGFIGTLKISSVSLVFGIMAGFVFAALRMSKYKVIAIPTSGIIEFLRMTPLLVQLFWVYFALPVVLGIKLDAFTAGAITFSLQNGAFFGEVFRGGIQSIDISQWEGGRAIGMRRSQLMRRVILPQAIRRMLPPLLERSFELIKGTTQMAVVAYGDLLYNSMILSARLYRPVEVLTTVAAFYLVFLTALSFIMRYIEHRFDARQA